MSQSKFSKNIPLNWVALILLLTFPLFLWLIPSDYFDNTGVVICPSRFLFDVECYGCGMTRAVLHFHHFEFEEAAYYNFLVFLVYPALVVLWFFWTRHVLRNLSIVPFKSI